MFATLDQAVAAAKAASRTTLDLDRRKVVIEAVRRATLEQAEMLARLAVEETGLGRVDDKTTKNRLCSTKTPGPEDLEVQAVSGASGMTITEFAPFGVVGSISPVTNPAATVINNAISIISAGNAVVFNAHPSARRVVERHRPAHPSRDHRRRGPTRPHHVRRRAHHRERPRR